MVIRWRRGFAVECRTCDQEVVGSSLGWTHSVKTLGKFLTPMCLCHQAVLVGTGLRTVMPGGREVAAGLAECNGSLLLGL